MFPNEIALLMAVNEKEGLGVPQLTHVTDITGSYLRYICNSLSLRGYLEYNNPKGYLATRKGKKAISQAIHGN